MLRVAVAFQTCDRFDYTERTLASFAHYNDLRRFVLVHADDASEDARVPALARSYGFETVVDHRVREGWRSTRAALVEAAAKRAGWILMLENDIESVRPFPWELWRYVLTEPWIYCLRLYGKFKDRERRDPCLTTHKRRNHEPVEWRPFRGAPEKSQVGLIHWSAQPCVTRKGELLALHRTGREPAGHTARVKKNVMVHIGRERTAAPMVRPDVLEATC